ncbi:MULTISPECIES: protein-tyrosine phosphatase family protein [Fischerella]|uniref:Protein phosphatase n=1 Tax=Fischerella muscicola CCMEE 5323 TaxID=2019572 RepID=A0A2N6JWF6_FISMU|nr:MULTISPECIES: dual specificity protein phosphatase family protein [Fischerella]MBD2433166.1 dual specificity protein phosphatase family protein [Fischerella sp. FACHB-380]PLZ84361.1 protein phosphatase [Fischerella muscicola CCMEE 5323]
MYKFAAACQSEPIVFGSARPGYSSEQVNQWIEFMQNQDIKRICCLLPHTQLTRYSNLLEIYRQKFGIDQVCWTPIEDFQYGDRQTLTQQILPFLAVADQRKEKVVVHCSGGVGRTGHVLAAWLVSKRGFSNQQAIAAVRKTGKNPYEAAIAGVLKGKNPWKMVAELNALLDDCRRAGIIFI